MADAIEALDDGLYALLVDPGLSIPVYQHVPYNAQPPFLVIGKIESEALREFKGDPRERLNAEVQILVRAPNRAAVTTQIAAVRAALDDATPLSNDHVFRPLEWQNSAADVDDDGETYIGLVYFETISEPA